MRKNESRDGSTGRESEEREEKPELSDGDRDQRKSPGFGCMIGPESKGVELRNAPVVTRVVDVLIIYSSIYHDSLPDRQDYEPILSHLQLLPR